MGLARRATLFVFAFFACVVVPFAVPQVALANHTNALDHCAAIVDADLQNVCYGNYDAQTELVGQLLSIEGAELSYLECLWMAFNPGPYPMLHEGFPGADPPVYRTCGVDGSTGKRATVDVLGDGGGGGGEPTTISGTVALSSDDRELLNLQWYGVAALVGLALVAMIAGRWFSSWRFLSE